MHIPLFRLLGSPEVVCGKELEFKTKKTLALLVYLLLERKPVGRETLVALLWPEAGEEDGRASLRNTLAYLKRSLEQVGLGKVITATREHLAFNAAIPHTLDVRLLETAFAFLTQASAENLEPLDMAAGQFRGELMGGFSLPDAPDFEEWLEVQRSVVQRQAIAVFEALSRLRLEGGEPTMALAAAERWLCLEPLSDLACRRVMELHLRLENPSAALQVFELFKDRMEREVGAEAEPQTLALAKKIRIEQGKPRVSRTISLEAPLVGRTAEHARLVEAYHAAMAGQAQAAIIEGEAGIGKTRLALEFLGWAKSQGARVLQGRSFETGGRLAYQPVVQLLRGWMESEADPKAVLSQVWLGELSALLPELPERFPELSPPTLDREVGPARLLEAVARLVLALGQEPLVIFVDDLHWADGASLDVLLYLVERIKQVKVLLLFTLRPEAPSDLGDWPLRLEHDFPLVRLDLSPLSQAATRQWLEALGSASDHFSSWLFEQTGGQPLYISQTLKHLSERGLLRPDSPQTLVSELVPGVREVIRARLKHLSPSAFALLAAGAVLGQDLDFALLSEVAGLAEDQALDGLDGLLSSRLLLEEANYRFTHDRIRDVAYTEAGDARRKVFHHRALSSLEKLKAPAATLAHHAFAAGRWAKAFGYSLEAAIESDIRNLPSSCQEHSLKARGLLREPPKGFDPIGEVSSQQRIDLYELLYDALLALREFEQAQQMATEALDYARSIRDVRLEIHALMLIHGRDSAFGQDQEGADLKEALAMAERIGNHRDWVMVQKQLIHHEFYRWDYNAAFKRGAQTLPVARALLEEVSHPTLEDITPLQRCLRMIAQAHIWCGQWQEGLAIYQEIEALFRPFQAHRLLVANGQIWQGALLLNMGRIEESLQPGRVSYEAFYELTPNNPFNTVASNWYSRSLLESGDLLGGFTVAKRGYELAQRPETDTFWRGGTHQNFAHMLLSLGRLEEALEVTLSGLAQNDELTRRNPWGLFYEDFLASTVATLYAMQQDWPKACEYAIRAAKARFPTNSEAGSASPRLRRDLEVEALLRGGWVELARESVERLGEHAGPYLRRQIPYLRALSVLEAWEGNLEDAIGHLEEARALMAPMGLPNERWTLELDLARMCAAMAQADKAEAAKRCGLEVVQTLADKVADPEMKQGFLEFAQNQFTLLRTTSSLPQR